MEKLTTRLRQLINGKELVIQPGIFDGYSARLVEQAGDRKSTRLNSSH